MAPSCVFVTLSLMGMLGHLALAKFVVPDVFEQRESDLLEYEDFSNGQKVRKRIFIHWSSPLV